MFFFQKNLILAMEKIVQTVIYCTIFTIWSPEINPQAIYVLERYDLKPFSLGNVVSCVIISSRLSGPPQPINCKSNYESFVKVKKSKENPRRRNV